MGGRRLSGILFRPSAHYRGARGRPGERLRDARKRLLYPRMLRNPELATVLSLDPYFATFAQRAYHDGGKVVALADPAARLREPSPGPSPFPCGRTAFLLFGELTARKGVLQFLEACAQLDSDTARRAAVLIAGRVAPELRRQSPGDSTRCGHGGPSFGLRWRTGASPRTNWRWRSPQVGRGRRALSALRRIQRRPCLGGRCRRAGHHAELRLAGSSRARLRPRPRGRYHGSARHSRRAARCDRRFRWAGLRCGSGTELRIVSRWREIRCARSRRHPRIASSVSGPITASPCRNHYGITPVSLRPVRHSACSESAMVPWGGACWGQWRGSSRVRLALQGQQTESGIAPGRVSARCASLRVVSGLVAAGDAVVIFASGAFAHWLAPLAWRAEAAQLSAPTRSRRCSPFISSGWSVATAPSGWSLGGALGRLMAGWFTTVGIAATLSWSVTAQVPFAGVWFLGWVASATAGLVFVRTVACVLINHLARDRRVRASCRHRRLRSRRAGGSGAVCDRAAR